MLIYVPAIATKIFVATGAVCATALVANKLIKTLRDHEIIVKKKGE